MKLDYKMTSLLGILLLGLMMFHNKVFYGSIIDYSFFNVSFVVLIINLISDKLRFEAMDKHRVLLPVIIVMITLITYSIMLPDFSRADVEDLLIEDFPQIRYDLKVLGNPESGKRHLFIKGGYAIYVTNRNNDDLLIYRCDSQNGELSIVE